MRARLKGRSPLAKGVGFLEEFSKNEVKGKVDIVALFASFGVRLEKKGSSWMGRCPSTRIGSLHLAWITPRASITALAVVRAVMCSTLL